MGLNFELEQWAEKASEAQHASGPLSSSPSVDSLSTASARPLPIPSVASRPPIRITQSSSLPSNVIASTRILTPPPAAAIPVARILPPANNSNRPPKKATIALSFVPANSKPASPPTSQATRPKQSALPNWIYEGGTDSLVARTIGSAEGTRTANGLPTKAYYGHTDPGNGVWNMGTFSYQHGATSPNEADRKQLKRLKTQGTTIGKQAQQAELTMTLGEVLNALDLANQSPRAALEQGGYIDRLVQARQKGMKDSEAIVWARTYAYLDPHTQRWNAPGLGNTLPSIQRDQNRRHDAIARAFNSYHAQRNDRDQSPEKILAAAPLESIQQPLSTTLANNKHMSHQDRKSIKPYPPMQLAFNIPESLQSSNHNTQSNDEPSTVAPISELEASQTPPKPLDTPQAHANPTVASFESPG
ncbi:MAG: hypothetical protein AAGF93_06435 [Cyanobacteria bacterium P01_H01_bin.105]